MEDTIVKILINSVKNYIEKNELNIKTSGTNFSHVEYYGRLLLLNFFQSLGYFKNINEKFFINDLKEKLSLIPKYNKLFDVLIQILTDEGFIKKINNEIMTTEKINSEKIADDLKNIDQYKIKLIEEHADMQPHFNLLDISIKNYFDILSGKKTGDEVLFPVFSINLVKNIFTENILADYFNETLSDIVYNYVKNYVKPGQDKLKILEIGSGTGGTSIFIMKKLSEFKDNIEFYFTDISNVFIKKAKKTYSENYPFSFFKKLNIENINENEDFQKESFDLIFASNVIHSTTNIDRSLKNISGLLKQNGIFLLNEVTKSQDFVNLTFGLMDGWWKFDDPEKRIENSPLLTMESWTNCLKENNFKNINIVTTSHEDKKDSFSQTLFIAQK